MLTGIAVLCSLRDSDTPHPRYLSSSFLFLTNTFWTHFNSSGLLEQIEQGIFLPSLYTTNELFTTQIQTYNMNLQIDF